MIILYGTTNQGKLDSMRRVVKDLGIEILGLCDLNQPIPRVDETGKDPLENAIIKAKAYFEAFAMPVFSCDSGLYFDDLEDALQPGTHIRRIGGKELTDDEMIEHYAKLSKKHNNKLLARYRNAIHLIINENVAFSSMDESLMSEAFLLTDKPHAKRVKGFPLDTISIDCASKKYYFDLEEPNDDTSAIYNGFKLFFLEALAKKL